MAALAGWGTLLAVPLGSRLVPLGPFDPGGWFAGRTLTVAELPLIAMLVIGGGLLVADLLGKLLQGTFGSDLLAGVAIVTSLLLGEYVAGVLVVLMLSGGEALESRAVSQAGDVLNALARRMPTVAHRRLEGRLVNVPLAELAVNDTIVVFDRIREVRGKNPAMTTSMVNLSLNQTLSRTLLTSLTTFIVVVILYCFGGEGIHGFAFCLVLGVIVGTYSSIYVASPVLLFLINRPGSEIGMATAKAEAEETKKQETATASA